MMSNGATMFLLTVKSSKWSSELIVYKNVCDYCGNEEIINEDAAAFVIRFTTLSAHLQENEKKRHPLNPFEVSYCSKDCFVEWIKENIRKDGKLIGHDDDT